MSGQGYEVLHYPGDVTGWEQAQPGRILGYDEFGRPYEVLDAEYEPGPDCPPVIDWPGPLCPGCGSEPGQCGRTTVQLQYATPEAIRAHMERIAAEAGEPS